MYYVNVDRCLLEWLTMFDIRINGPVFARYPCAAWVVDYASQFLYHSNFRSQILGLDIQL